MAKPKVKKHRKAETPRDPMLAIRPPNEVSERDFRILYGIFYDVNRGNSSLCARLLGVTRPTWMKWAVEQPKSPLPAWGMHRLLVEHQQQHIIRATRSSKSAATNTQIRIELRRLSSDFKSPDTEKPESWYAAEIFLIKEIIESVEKQIYTDELFKAGATHIPRSALYRAARRLGLLRLTTGFKDKKVSVWRLPPEWGFEPTLHDEDDEDDEED